MSNNYRGAIMFVGSCGMGGGVEQYIHNMNHDKNEKEKQKYIYIYIYIHIHTYIYIYIYMGGPVHGRRRGGCAAVPRGATAGVVVSRKSTRRSTRKSTRCQSQK